MFLRVFSFAAAVLTASCASNAGGNAGASANVETLRELAGRQMASPVALLFAGMDRDGDAVIDRAEIRAQLEALYSAGDDDGSGGMDGVEFLDWSTAYLGAGQTVPGRLHFDRNQDASISFEEFERALLTLSEDLDQNDDGRLVRAEMLFTVSGLGIDSNAMRAEMQAEMRRRAQQMCRGGRGM